MTAYDDTTIIAYLDGELDETDCAEFERALETDPALPARVEAFAESGMLLRAALAPATHGPMPALPAPDFAASAVPARAAWMPRAIAAAFAFVCLGGAFGYLAGQRVADRDDARVAARIEADGRIREATFQRAMEVEVSGTPVRWRNPDGGAEGLVKPVRTFRNKNDQFCRQYDRSESTGDRGETVSGIACRDEQGQWRVRAVYYGQ